MNNIENGTIVYSYCFGPMTVIAVDDRFITLSVNDPSGFSQQFSEYTSHAGSNLSHVRFLKASVGHWLFLSIAEVKESKGIKSFTEGNTSYSLHRNDEFLHSIYQGHANVTSGLTEKQSFTTGLTEKRSITTGLTEKRITSTGLTEKM